jgi:hypothetical protein
VGVLWRRAL